MYRKIRFFRSFARASFPPNAVVGADEGVGQVLQDPVPVVNQALSLSEEKPPAIGQRFPFVGDRPVSRHEDSHLVSSRASCSPLSHGQTLNPIAVPGRSADQVIESPLSAPAVGLPSSR